MDNVFYFEKFLLEEDFSYYWNLVSNEKLMVMNYGRVFTIEEAKMTFNFLLESSKKHKDYGGFKVFKADTNSFMGLGSIDINDNFTEAEIEYLLLPDYWGKGYGSEIVRQLLHKVSGIKSMEKITAITDPNNIASKKILLKYGFTSQEVFEIDDGSLAEMFIKKI